MNCNLWLVNNTPHESRLFIFGKFHSQWAIYEQNVPPMGLNSRGTEADIFWPLHITQHCGKQQDNRYFDEKG